MAVNINVPSQVKTYANLAAFPATGALKTIYIAEDTNKTYRWTGSVYVEVSGADFSGYVPTSRTLTINGTTQDLSADRTFTISTGITIGTTAITSGTVGRVLFEGAGNVVQESANLFWDNTNARFGIGGTPTTTLDVIGGASSGFDAIKFKSQYSAIGYLGSDNGQVWISSATGGAGTAINLSQNRMTFRINSSEAARFADATRNFLIGTTTDAGFKLDVNGTARVQNTATIVGTNPFLFINNNSTGIMGVGYQNAGVDQAYTGIASTPNAAIIGSLTHDYYIRSLNRRIILSANNGGAIQAMLFSTGNFAINTTTDAGFRLDVNGSARIKGAGTTVATISLDVQNSSGASSVTCYDDLSVYINGKNTSGYTTNIRIGGQSNQANISFFGNNNIYVGQSGSVENIPSALIAMGSTTKGFLPPRMTTTQRNAIASPAAGLMVYDTTLNVIMYYNGTMWI